MVAGMAAGGTLRVLRRTSSVPMRGWQGTMTADRQRRSQLSDNEVSFSAGSSARWCNFQRPKKPVTEGFAVLPICYRLFGNYQLQNGTNKPWGRIERRDPDQTPGHFQPGIRMPDTSESNNIQASVTRQPHTSHVLPSIERIDSIPSGDSRSLEATDSLSNAVCFEWPATTRFRARYRGSADSINPTDGKRRKQFLLSALLCAFRFYRPLGRDKGNQIVSIVTRCNSIQVVIDRFVADTHTVRIDSKTLEAGANTRKGQ